MKLSRRSLFIGAASIIAAPAIIRVAQLMPIKPYLVDLNEETLLNAMIAPSTWGESMIVTNRRIFAELRKTRYAIIDGECLEYFRRLNPALDRAIPAES